MKTIKINGFTMSLIVGFTILVYACKTDMMDYEGVDGVYFVMQRKPPSGYGDPEQYEYVDTTYIRSVRPLQKIQHFLFVSV